MKRLLLLALPLMAGCSAWNEAQLGLVTQARKGMALVAQADAQRDTVAMELAKLRRQRLDEAFDADVRTRELLDADWVIDTRKAYGAALDAYAKAQASDDANSQRRRENLAAIDASLERLQWLISVQAKFNILENQP